MPQGQDLVLICAHALSASVPFGSSDPGPPTTDYGLVTTNN